MAFKRFTSFDDATINAIYSKEEADFLKDLMNYSKLSQGAERIAGNPSGTAQSVITFEAGKAMIKNPVTGTSYWLIPSFLAKAYLSPTMRKWLTTGFKTSENVPKAMEVYTKVLTFGGRDILENQLKEDSEPTPE